MRRAGEILDDHCAAGQVLSPVASGDPRRPAARAVPWPPDVPGPVPQVRGAR